jgi:hypothetical protein
MTMANISDAECEYVWNVGKDRPHCAWILSPYDTWHKNPYYTGTPKPHPEFESYDE